MKPSNIGGQAVMEGVMMKNQNKYAVAVRKPDHKIEVKISQHKMSMPLSVPQKDFLFFVSFRFLHLHPQSKL